MVPNKNHPTIRPVPLSGAPLVPEDPQDGAPDCGISCHIHHDWDLDRSYRWTPRKITREILRDHTMIIIYFGLGSEIQRTSGYVPIVFNRVCTSWLVLLNNKNQQACCKYTVEVNSRISSPKGPSFTHTWLEWSWLSHYFMAKSTHLMLNSHISL